MYREGIVEKIRRKNMIFNTEDIKMRLPHRYPMLMVDRIIEQDVGRCVGLKNVTINECFFLGHFPSQAIMPGSLIVECMSQVTAFVGLSTQDNKSFSSQGINDKGMYVTSVNVKFKRPVIPGDQLLVKVELMKAFGKQIKVYAEAKVDGDVAAGGELNLMRV